MSATVKNPNAKGKGALWAILLVLVLLIGAIFYVVSQTRTVRYEKVAGDTQSNLGLTVTPTEHGILLASDKAGDDTPVAELFEDFSCHYCAQLAELQDADMLAALQAGKMKVEIRTMSFLDGAAAPAERDGHSTHAGAAALAAAQTGDADLYWNARAAMMTKQSDIVNRWSDEDFANFLQTLGGDDALVEAVKSESAMEEFKQNVDFNESRLREIGERVSSPRVFLDGKEINDTSNFVAVVTGEREDTAPLAK